MSHESKPILLGECSTRKETQRPSLARSLAAGHKWRACSQANTHALVKPCKYNQDISQQYGTNICNQCKRSTCRSWRVTQVVLATSELATCYESSDIHQSARCKEESKVHPDENKLCNAAPTNTYQTEQISLYVQNLWLTCELIHQKREQENDFRLRSFDLHRPPPPRPSTPNKQPQCSVLCQLKDDVNIIGYICKRRCQDQWRHLTWRTIFFSTCVSIINEQLLKWIRCPRVAFILAPLPLPCTS